MSDNEIEEIDFKDSALVLFAILVLKSTPEDRFSGSARDLYFAAREEFSKLPRPTQEYISNEQYIIWKKDGGIYTGKKIV